MVRDAGYGVGPLGGQGCGQEDTTAQRLSGAKE